MSEIFEAPSVPGLPVPELRAIVDADEVTVEMRWTAPVGEPSPWTALHIGTLITLMATAGPVGTWLQSIVLEHGAWFARASQHATRLGS